MDSGYVSFRETSKFLNMIANQASALASVAARDDDFASSEKLTWLRSRLVSLRESADTAVGNLIDLIDEESVAES